MSTASFVQITLELPIYARSEANGRDHHLAKARRVKEQRGVVYMRLRAAASIVAMVGRLDSSAIFVIRLTRIHTRRAKPLDDDNLRGSLKAVRDGVADALGIDDGDKRLIWDYAQEPGGDYAVRIEIDKAGRDA